MLSRRHLQIQAGLHPISEIAHLCCCYYLARSQRCCSSSTHLFTLQYEQDLSGFFEGLQELNISKYLIFNGYFYSSRACWICLEFGFSDSVSARAKPVRFVSRAFFLSISCDTLGVAPRVNYASAQLQQVHHEKSPQCIGRWCKQWHR